MDKTKLTEVDGLFRQARVSLLKSHPWWGALALRLTPVYTDSVEHAELAISATDGRSLFINADDFAKRDLHQRRYIVFHEMMHCALGHIFRLEKRDVQVWNIATDIHIHNIGEQEGFRMLPDIEEKLTTYLNSLLFSDRRHFRGWSAEKTYEVLLNRASKSPTGSVGGGAGCCHSPGKATEDKGSTAGQASANQVEREWKSAVLDAAAKLAGKHTGVWNELIAANSRASVCWTDYLQEFLTRGLGGDYRWLPSNRRFISDEIYFPTTSRIVAGEIGAFIDTSGSMSADDLGLAWAELREFREQYECSIHLIHVDYIAQHYEYFGESDDLPDKLHARGRGGTSFDPPFTYCRDKSITPRVAIYFTDGEGSCYVPQPDYPVLWVQIPRLYSGKRIFSDFAPPFGELIRVGG